MDSYEETYEQVLDMVLVLNQTFSMLSDVVRLEIISASSMVDLDLKHEGGSMVDIEWLELLRPFTAVETLRVCLDFAESVAHSLKGITVEMATQMLPALNSLTLEGQHTRTIKRFSTILRGCGRSITISDDPDGILKNDPYPLQPLAPFSLPNL